MKIVDKKINEVLNEKKVNSKFFTVKNENQNIECNILTQNFYLDSFNYFPLTEEYYSFFETFAWGDILKYNNFYSDEFLKNFQKNLENFSSMSDIFILGSNSFNNYYSNLFNFLPRIFFIKEKKIKLAVHRNSSTKFRNFIFYLCEQMNIKIQLVYLDDGFYKFSNSQIPQFFDTSNSIKILSSIEAQRKTNKHKIYITRRNDSFRNLINEGDVIKKLKKLDFKIVDLKSLEIIDQVNLFANASCVISATGSGLANIVFCKPGTKIIEISPRYQFEYERHLKSRYSFVANKLDLEYLRLEADSIEIKNINTDIKNIIPQKIIKNSNYYKNLLVKLNDIENILDY